MKEGIILLVEDDPLTRKFVGEMFAEDYEVLEAPSCTAALGYARSNIDIALIDYVLPDGDGIKLVKSLLIVNPSLPAILMTAYNHESVIVEALRAGVRDYVRKPMEIPDLRRRVSTLMGCPTRCRPSDRGGPRKRRDFIIDSIVRHVQENLAGDMTLDLLAGRAGMDKSGFCRAFKERTGKSFITFLNGVRIKRAAELLKNKDLSITDIAFFVGFGSAEHFTRTFKAVLGASPRKYRERSS